MPNKNQIFHVAPLSLVLGAIVSCGTESPPTPVPESEVSPSSGPESSVTPSARLLEFLNKTDDPEFLQSFNSQPGVLFKEYGITSYEVNVIVNASHKRFAPRDVQEKKVTSALKRLGIDPAQHAALVKKLVDNYNVAW